MAQSKYQKFYKNTLALRKLVKLITIALIITISLIFLVNYIFFKNPQSSGYTNTHNNLSNADIKQLSNKILGIYIKNVVQSKYSLELITAESWKIILNPEYDIKQQLRSVYEVLKQMTKQERKNLKYIGADVQGQIYYLAK